MSNTLTPSVIVVTPQTITLEEISLEMISQTLSASITMTIEYISTSITTTTIATSTTVPTNGIFVSTTGEIITFVIITAVIGALVVAILQFRRVRNQKDYMEQMEELRKVVIKPVTPLTNNGFTH